MLLSANYPLKIQQKRMSKGFDSIQCLQFGLRAFLVMKTIDDFQRLHYPTGRFGRPYLAESTGPNAILELIPQYVGGKFLRSNFVIAQGRPYVEQLNTA